MTQIRPMLQPPQSALEYRQCQLASSGRPILGIEATSVAQITRRLRDTGAGPGRLQSVPVVRPTSAERDDRKQGVIQ